MLTLLCKAHCGIVVATSRVVDGMLVARCSCGKSRVYGVADEGYRPRAYVPRGFVAAVSGGAR